MITLYGFGPGFGLPEISPYVTKTEVQLKMAGLPYRKEAGRSDRSPKGQLPFIEDGGELISDSTFIRAHLEAKYAVDLDAGLSEVRRAEAWTVERMLENHLGWCMIHSRWLLKPNFDKGPAHFFDGAPEAMRGQLRQDVHRQVNANVRAVGIGRHSDDEIADLGEKSLSALALLLGERTYLLGDRPAGVDAVMFGMLAAILTPFFDSPLRRRAERFGTLTAYVERMMARYYPDFAWAGAGASAPRAAAFA
jgi:glutathione S-transferase